MIMEFDILFITKEDLEKFWKPILKEIGYSEKDYEIEKLNLGYNINLMKNGVDMKIQGGNLLIPLGNFLDDFNIEKLILEDTLFVPVFNVHMKEMLKDMQEALEAGNQSHGYLQKNILRKYNTRGYTVKEAMEGSSVDPIKDAVRFKIINDLGFEEIEIPDYIEEEYKNKDYMYFKNDNLLMLVDDNFRMRLIKNGKTPNTASASPEWSLVTRDAFKITKAAIDSIKDKDGGSSFVDTIMLAYVFEVQKELNPDAKLMILEKRR